MAESKYCRTSNVKAGPALNQLDQLPLHFTVLYCTLPVVTCSVNDMFVDPAELFATHLYIPLSSMLRFVSVRLVLM